MGIYVLVYVDKLVVMVFKVRVVITDSKQKVKTKEEVNKKKIF